MGSLKINWIKLQLASYPNQPANQITSALNTRSLVANPITEDQARVPKPVSITEVAKTLSANDRRLMQREGAWHSLVANINAGKLEDALLDIENLATTPELAQETLGILATIPALATQTMPDPNWQAEVMLSPAEMAQFDKVEVWEVEEALAS